MLEWKEHVVWSMQVCPTHLDSRLVERRKRPAVVDPAVADHEPDSI